MQEVKKNIKGNMFIIFFKSWESEVYKDNFLDFLLYLKLLLALHQDWDPVSV